MTLETRNSSSQVLYDNRDSWTSTDVAYGTLVTSDEPAIGRVAAGSHIPGGRFLITDPRDIDDTTNATKRAILPDYAGTNLIQNDGADFSALIADSRDDNNFFRFLGVSILPSQWHDICLRAQIHENARFRGDEARPFPESLINAQGEPIGYEDEQSYRNYIEYGYNVGIATQDAIAVYTETDIGELDDIYVRVGISSVGATPLQLLGGVTATFEDDGGGSNDETLTQDLSLSFPNARIRKPATAGSAVVIELS